MACRDPLSAYLLDKAVLLFGNCVERDVEKSSSNKKGKAAEAAANGAIARWVVSGPAAKGRYRTPQPTQ